MITAAVLICLAPVVIDGDTVKCGNGSTSIRIFAINAPELSTLEGPPSRDALVPLVVGGLICEPKGASYNRTVAICNNATGLDIGRAQLNSGHATEWCSYSRNYYGTCKQGD